MSFAREGYALLLGATGLAAVAFAAALRLRNWPLWLTAFGLTIAALVVAWMIRPAIGSNA